MQESEVTRSCLANMTCILHIHICSHVCLVCVLHMYMYVYVLLVFVLHVLDCLLLAQCVQSVHITMSVFMYVQEIRLELLVFLLCLRVTRLCSMSPHYCPTLLEMNSRLVHVHVGNTNTCMRGENQTMKGLKLSHCLQLIPCAIFLSFLISSAAGEEASPRQRHCGHYICGWRES